MRSTNLTARRPAILLKRRPCSHYVRLSSAIVCALVASNRITVPIIEKDSIADPAARELLQRFEELDIELYLGDFSLDTGISTVGGLAIDRSTFPAASEIVFTAGTATDPEKAVIRTLTEIAQLAGDFNTTSRYVASGLPKPTSLARGRLFCRECCTDNDCRDEQPRRCKYEKRAHQLHRHPCPARDGCHHA